MKIDFSELLKQNQHLNICKKRLFQEREREENHARKEHSERNNRRRQAWHDLSVKRIQILESEIEKKENDLMPIKRQIYQESKHLESWQAKEAIRLRFIEGKTVKEVAESIGYSTRQTNRFLIKAETQINHRPIG